jgi:hypothetical protein
MYEHTLRSINYQEYLHKHDISHPFIKYVSGNFMHVFDSGQILFKYGRDPRMMIINTSSLLQKISYVHVFVLSNPRISFYRFSKLVGTKFFGYTRCS